MNLTVHHAFLPHDDPEAALAFYRDVPGYNDMRWITVGPPGDTGTSIVLQPPVAASVITDDERGRSPR